MKKEETWMLPPLARRKMRMYRAIQAVYRNELAAPTPSVGRSGAVSRTFRRLWYSPECEAVRAEFPDMPTTREGIRRIINKKL